METEWKQKHLRADGNTVFANEVGYEKLLERYGLKCLGGNKWVVRLDTMDANTRKKIEA